ncbi:MAG: signal peptidase II [Aaplasma endosymbiont of Hyalomma asiaticum]
MVKYSVGALVLIFVVVLDQVSKWYVFGIHVQHGPMQIFEFCNLVQFWNRGISFGMLNSIKNSNLIFTWLSVALMCSLVFVLVKTESKLKAMCICSVLGGSLGNLFDRLRFGAVYDFIDLHIGDFHWPAFNIADSFIVLGVVSFLLLEAKSYINNEHHSDGA